MLLQRQDLQFALIYTNLTSGKQTLLDVSDSLSSLNVRNVPSHVKVGEAACALKPPSRSRLACHTACRPPQRATAWPCVPCPHGATCDVGPALHPYPWTAAIALAVLATQRRLCPGAHSKRGAPTRCSGSRRIHAGSGSSGVSGTTE